MLRCIAPQCTSPREVGALFCRVHLAYPPGKRGGWISAEKRRRKLANHPVTPLDASNITRRLWVGSKPPFDRDLPDFGALVLCAEEEQPDRLAFSRQVIRVPIHDGILNMAEVNRVIAGARESAKALASGKTVLVTCYAGLNRSALVASLALGLLTRSSASEIILLMRERRAPAALSNPFFCELIHRFVGQRQRGDGMG